MNELNASLAAVVANLNQLAGTIAQINQGLRTTFGLDTPAVPPAEAAVESPVPAVPAVPTIPAAVAQRMTQPPPPAEVVPLVEVAAIATPEPVAAVAPAAPPVESTANGKAPRARKPRGN